MCELISPQERILTKNAFLQYLNPTELKVRYKYPGMIIICCTSFIHSFIHTFVLYIAHCHANKNLHGSYQ